MLSYDFSYKKNKNKNSPYSYLQGMIHSSGYEDVFTKLL